MSKKEESKQSSISRRSFFKIGGLSVAAYGAVSSLLGSEQNPTPVLAEIKKKVQKIKPLTTTDYGQRIEGATRLLHKHKLDALLLTGGTNLKYFTNVNWWRSERFFGVIIPHKGEPVWICPAFELERAKERVKFGKDIRTWDEHENPYLLVKGVMKDLGAASGTLAIGPTVRHFFVDGIQQHASSLHLANGAAVTEGCRGIKSAKEIGFMDLANRLTKMAYREAFKQLQEGMTPSEMSAHTRQAHSQMGASGGGYPSFGENSAFPHGSSKVRHLRKGDIVLIDGGCSIQGYRSDVTRTIVFGPPSSQQRKVFDVVLKAQQAAFKVVKPGVACQEIDRAARRVIDQAGYGPDYKFFAHRLGHGIGMEGHEYPYLVKGNTLKLKPGMTFSNEPGIYMYGKFGVRIEDCFAVTGQGVKVLGGWQSTDVSEPFGR